jgi:hypothetical protein
MEARIRVRTLRADRGREEESGTVPDGMVHDHEVGCRGGHWGRFLAFGLRRHRSPGQRLPDAGAEPDTNADADADPDEDPPSRPFCRIAGSL